MSFRGSSPYKAKKIVYKKPRQIPPPAKRCDIVITATGQTANGRLGSFPSRRQAKKTLAKIVMTLPPRAHPEEPDKYYIRNV